jgi:ABC-type uncharacterized transport system substrate-binding protein
MDTKINREGGERKASEAYALYQKIRPDGVITADDNAQQMFVLPYLKNKVETPVMFSGVNAEPEKYGYPASNVSGILERGHIRESIAFAKQLVPSIDTIGFVASDNPSGRAMLRQVEEESDTYSAKLASFNLVKTTDELISLGGKLNNLSDAIYTDSLVGIKDDQGISHSHKDVLNLLAANYDKPVIGANQYHVEQGALCAVIKTGQEQGETAAEMLLKAMQGTPVSEIPITRNYQGKRVINVTTMKSLGIQPRPVVLLGAELLKTE